MKSYASRCPRAASRVLLILLVISFLLLAVSPTAARAQDLDEVTISGRVTDQTGALLPNASVTAVLVATGVERSVTADREGRYRLIELNPGVYTVRASFSGFATEEKTELTTIAGQNVQLDFTLRPADVTAEQVVVSEADSSPVDTTRTVVGGTVVTEEIESLPNASRDPLDLIFTLGGVTEEPLSTRNLAEDRGTNPNSTTPEEAGSFALSGGPAYSNNITIDGLDNNDDRAARERFSPSVEAVEEVQVITNQARVFSCVRLSAEEQVLITLLRFAIMAEYCSDCLVWMSWHTPGTQATGILTALNKAISYWRQFGIEPMNKGVSLKAPLYLSVTELFYVRFC